MPVAQVRGGGAVPSQDTLLASCLLTMALVNLVKKIGKARDGLGMAENEKIVEACTANSKGSVK